MMTGSYDPLFVILSVVIAALASYAALDLAGRVRSAEGSTRLGWLAGGATVMGLGIWSMHFVAMLAFHLPVPIEYEQPQMLLSVAVAIGASLLALVVVSRVGMRAVTLVMGGIISMQSKIAFTKQLTAQAIQLAQQFDESQRLTSRLEAMNGELQRSLADAYRSRRALAEQHQVNLELQRAAQLEAIKARWLEGIAETSTAVAHEINNPLTSLIIHAEMLEEVDSRQALDSIAEIRRAARRIALVVRRLGRVGAPHSVRYVGESRMLDLWSKDSEN